MLKIYKIFKNQSIGVISGESVYFADNQTYRSSGEETRRRFLKYLSDGFSLNLYKYVFRGFSLSVRLSWLRQSDFFHDLITQKPACSALLRPKRYPQ